MYGNYGTYRDHRLPTEILGQPIYIYKTRSERTHGVNVSVITPVRDKNGVYKRNTFVMGVGAYRIDLDRKVFIAPPPATKVWNKERKREVNAYLSHLEKMFLVRWNLGVYREKYWVPHRELRAAMAQLGALPEIPPMDALDTLAQYIRRWENQWAKEHGETIDVWYKNAEKRFRDLIHEAAGSYVFLTPDGKQAHTAPRSDLREGAAYVDGLVVFEADHLRTV